MRFTATIPLLFGAFALSACGEDSPETASLTAPGAVAAFSNGGLAGHKTTEHVRIEEAIEETLVNPCNGEEVHLVGEIVVQENHTGQLDAQGNLLDLHREVNGWVHETGVGLTTGATYELTDRFHESFNSPSGPALKVTFTARERAVGRSSEPGLAFSAGFSFHFVSLPDGSFKVTRNVDSGGLVCEG